MKAILAIIMTVFTVNVFAQQVEVPANSANIVESNILDELNPFDPNIEEKLRQMDKQYEQETGMPAFDIPAMLPFIERSGCYRLTCTVYARVIKAEQKLYLYINGRLDYTWDVSTGASGHRTPDFDQHPNGRIYDKYSSKAWPGGDYQGLGNMPYAVFIRSGFAIHGTTEGNFKKLGTTASHGCIRVHPENGRIFNRLVRQYGIKDTWITVE